MKCSVSRPVEEVALRDLEKKDPMGSGLGGGCRSSAYRAEFVAQSSWRSYTKYYSTRGRHRKNFSNLREKFFHENPGK